MPPAVANASPQLEQEQPVPRDTADTAVHAGERLRVEHLERSNLELRRRETLLTAAARALKDLLSSRDLNEGVAQALRRMGEAAGMHRVKVILQRTETAGSGALHELVYEWWSPELASQTSLGLTRFPNEAMSVYLGPLLAGQSVWQLIDEVPAAFLEPFKRAGMQSMGIVPIFAGSRYIGLVAFDDCQQRRVWLETEMDALTIAARGLGAAIQREQLESEKIEAVALERAAGAKQRAAELDAVNRELEHRNRLLAAAARSSALLAAREDFDVAVVEAMGLVAEAAGFDRAAIVEFSDAQGEPNSNYWRITHEWCGNGAVPQLGGPHASGTHDAMPAHAAQIFDGERIFDCITTELTDLAARRIQESVGARYYVTGRIWIDGRAWGAFACDDCTTERRRSEEEKGVIGSAARAIGQAIHRRRLEQRAETLRRQILTERASAARDRAGELAQANAALRRSTANLVELPDLPAFLGSLLLSAVETTGAKSGAVFTYDETTEILLLTACVIDRRIVAIDRDPRLELWRTPVPEAVRRPWIDQLRRDDAVWFDYQNPPAEHAWPVSLAWHAGMGHRLVVDLPLTVGGKLVGFLGQCFTTSEWPNPFALEQVRVLAQQASVAIQLSRLAANARDVAVQAERNRLAREIHDTLAQSFTGILLQLEAADLLREQGDARAAERYRKIRAQAQLGLAETRRTALALAPEALNEGLLPALTQLCQRSHVEERMRCTFTYEGLARRLGGLREERLLRVAKEALSNAVRHGRATEITLHLAFAPTEVRLTVTDNGAGFSITDPSGLGLPNMRAALAEAGGFLQVTSAPNAGTTVTATVPLTDGSSAKHPMAPIPQKS
jgi:signal transduction histidine kinase